MTTFTDRDGNEATRDAAGAVPAVRTFGVEEEFVLVDPELQTVRAAASRVLAHGATARLDPAGAGDLPGDPHYDRYHRYDDLDGELDVELAREQVESGSGPQTSLAGLRASLVALRQVAAAAARAEGVALAATGTSPIPVKPTLTAKPRYQRMVNEFGLTAREQLTCGCHVHVAVNSPAEAVGALDRLRPWLSPLVAMTANSPFWQGQDTGYASYRTQVWQRWPTAGATAAFGSPEEYDRVVDLLVGSGAALDDGMIYFDVRLSRRYPTIELRVADVCLAVDDSLLLAALARALVTTAAREWAAGVPAVEVRPELLRAAAWRASRYGLVGELFDLERRERVPARVLVDRLVVQVGPALAEVGDADTVADRVDRLFARGTGAQRQRAAYGRRQRLSDVVDLVVCETLEA